MQFQRQFESVFIRTLLGFCRGGQSHALKHWIYKTTLCISNSLPSHLFELSDRDVFVVDGMELETLKLSLDPDNLILVWKSWVSVFTESDSDKISSCELRISLNYVQNLIWFYIQVWNVFLSLYWWYCWILSDSEQKLELLTVISLQI